MNIVRKAVIGVACLVASHIAPALADERVLLIASDYSQADEPLHLANPVSDAGRIETAFRKAGQTDVELVSDPDLAALNRAVDEFIGRLSRDDVAIVYYAGHAVQYLGENYLLAGDGKSFVSFNSLIRRVSDRAKAALFLVDACRNNPFAAVGSGRSVTLAPVGATATRDLQIVDVASLASAKGLAQLADLRGLSTVVFFSTEPGNVALDGEQGEGSPFAVALAKEIRRRQSLDALLRRTAIEVNRRTDGRQSPWRQGDIPFDVFIAGMKAMAIP
jgi:uncharacterized caspase-like protein